MTLSIRYEELTGSHWTSLRITLHQMGSFISQQNVDVGLDGRSDEISRSWHNFTVIIGDRIKPDSLTHFWRSTGFWYE